MNEIGQNSFTPGVTQAVFVPDQLVSGPLQLVTDTVSLSAGVLRRGTVLGQITTTKAYIQSVKTAMDGSQVPCAILVDDADATTGAVQAGVYLMGEFNQHRVIFDDSWTLADLAVALRPYSIFLRSSLTASNT
ncbi:head decoration protein [Yersinia ruckeri]|uniref:head decoration protein n=2 Tax=Yersinia ruckeri TaxID=29486 RepID=UPI002238689A|nr:head decoration protein [Yersinia ruckeri]MCW6521737.1 head decoration protein [Yersinia ruckeri]MCW6587849.1 head decoration protein [Yersinia ruckeri]